MDDDCPSSRPVCTESPYAASLRRTDALTRARAAVSAAKVEQLAAQAAAGVLLVSAGDEAGDVVAGGQGLEVVKTEDDDEDEDDDDDDDDDEDGGWCTGLLASCTAGAGMRGGAVRRCMPSRGLTLLARHMEAWGPSAQRQRDGRGNG